MKLEERTFRTPCTKLAFSCTAPVVKESKEKQNDKLKASLPLI